MKRLQKTQDLKGFQHYHLFDEAGRLLLHEIYSPSGKPILSRTLTRPIPSKNQCPPPPAPGWAALPTHNSTVMPSENLH